MDANFRPLTLSRFDCWKKSNGSNEDGSTYEVVWYSHSKRFSPRCSSWRNEWPWSQCILPWARILGPPCTFCWRGRSSWPSGWLSSRPNQWGWSRQLDCLGYWRQSEDRKTWLLYENWKYQIILYPLIHFQRLDQGSGGNVQFEEAVTLSLVEVSSKP